MFQALNAAALRLSTTVAVLLQAGTPHAAIHQATGAVAAVGADQAAARSAEAVFRAEATVVAFRVEAAIVAKLQHSANSL